MRNSRHIKTRQHSRSMRENALLFPHPLYIYIIYIIYTYIYNIYRALCGNTQMRFTMWLTLYQHARRIVNASSRSGTREICSPQSHLLEVKNSGLLSYPPSLYSPFRPRASDKYRVTCDHERGSPTLFSLITELKITRRGVFSRAHQPSLTTHMYLRLFSFFFFPSHA